MVREYKCEKSEHKVLLMRTREIGNDKLPVTKASGHFGLPVFGPKSSLDYSRTTHLGHFTTTKIYVFIFKHIFVKEILFIRSGGQSLYCNGYMI